MSRRSTYNAGPAAYHRRDAATEAAKHLANIARRFVADRATATDVDDAIEAWNRVSDAPSPDPPAAKEER